jgi:hypothetical protein
LAALGAKYINPCDMEEQMSKQNNQNEYSVKDKAYEEGMKLFYDLFKHMTTVCTGSILILITFLEKLFSNPVWKSLVGYAFGGFILSILTSLILMVYISNLIRNFGHSGDVIETIMSIIAIIVVVSFLFAIVCLAVFAMKNLYQ